uniref:Zinc transporter ZIP2 n=1 Tax=Strombidium inclinatum TaxID=197538 RepID=A0A7S3MY37_9SPIT|mmetsp:Transcript_35711/g.54653  ORF Transcript_35711/g.54653 Transcript_35711/m.54653 type:complete len:174 (+) Transcript_35711:394-915(+)|eukprot:CAMPEP_0170497268 /NCGR_PEP_ID=MMETSP0208-20121228/24248_1 /TAXON_ID=197538 /ORGANISM="Strombidium inclinatum, Strain S3" /LENGTH=173 /DNA_ID=CAMNT_0010774037 /DNA_START=534 /DNA_END=1055 /DNA_ORIENTATION=+
MQSLIRDQEDEEKGKSITTTELASLRHVSSMTPFVILIGLGVHALFEGLSLGLSNKTSSSVIFAVAILLHKGAAGLSLGISMAKTFPGKDAFVTKMMLLFALFTPLGVVLGWLLQGRHQLTEIIFSCLAAGSFLYIACSEVIVEEFSESTRKGQKLFFYLLGISLICSLMFFE